MPMMTSRDGVRLYYKDWGTGPCVVFSHGWPLSSDAWDEQMFALASKGYRCIAHDRRGHGRSDQPWTGNDMDHYADDLADLILGLDIASAVHVGHSTGGGEVARYVARHGTGRVAGTVLIGAVTPMMIQSQSNPDGLPQQVFDDIRAGLLKDRSQFFQDLSAAFYGANRAGSLVSQGQRDWFWEQGMRAGLKNLYDCVDAFSATDQTKDLMEMNVPCLILHGDDDQIVPLELTSARAAKLAPQATLKVYAGAPHGMTSTHKNQLNADLLAFSKQHLEH